MSLISRCLPSLSLRLSELNGGFGRHLSPPVPAAGGQSFGAAIPPAQAHSLLTPVRGSAGERPGDSTETPREFGVTADSSLFYRLGRREEPRPPRVTGVPAVLPSPSSRHVCPLPRGSADPPGPRRALPAASLSSPTLGALLACFPPGPLVLSKGGSATWPEGDVTSALLRNPGGRDTAVTCRQTGPHC